MKLYPKYPTAISALAFSPDGTKLAIGASYEHDNAVSVEDQGRVMMLIKNTVMEDCKVSRRHQDVKGNLADERSQKQRLRRRDASMQNLHIS